MKHDTRIQILDALRGLAAMAVVGYHYSTRYPTLYGGTPFPFEFPAGIYGVNVFFMISGFVIYMTLDAIKHPADFIVSRFSRLYPVYWVAMSLTAVVLALYALPGQSISFAQYLGNLSMIHEFFHVASVDGVYWTLTVELRFYFWLFLLWLLGLHRQPQRFVLVWLMLVALRGYFPAIASTLLILEYFPLFGFGIMVRELLRNHWRGPIEWFVAITCMVSVPKIDAMLMVSFAAIVYFSPRLLLIRPLLWLGAISYPLYLIHQNIGYVIIHRLSAHPLSGLIALSVAVTLASLLTLYVERPATAKLRMGYRSWRARRAGPLQPAPNGGLTK